MLRKILTAVAGLILIVILYRVLGVYRFRSGECSSGPAAAFAPTYPRTLRVMSFNIEGHAALFRSGHIAEIAETIRRYRPDVVALNEVHRGTWQARFDDQVEELRRRTGMNALFAPSYSFAGGEFGNALLTRGRVVSSDAYSLPGTGEPRSLLEGVVDVNGGIVSFYVTHTSAWGPIGKSARGQQLHCVADHIHAAEHPFVLAGDLNAPPSSEEIASFISSNGLQLTGRADAATHKVTGDRLDYILAGGGWRVTAARVLDDGPSDHRPILTELAHP